MRRAKPLQEFLDKVSEESFGKSLSDCEKEKICVFCHKPVGEFKDALSQKEFGISGLCQKCQDGIFG